MSSPSNAFECRWHASRQLLAAYLLAQLFALGSLILLSIPLWASLLGVVLCVAHGFWVLPRQILLTHPQAFRGLRRDADGWQLWNQAVGWQPVQLRRDSLALPLIVVLRFRLRDERRVRAICVPRDSQAADMHRRLRVRLKFSRRRWAAPE
ncbi:protein YgfX [Pseudomonas sp. Irchel s3b2]|uniref:protein YgfX n=1 Tax=Pseudomonas sp. Irchel s3b2 TaxID=2009073 RepID=UPI000BA4A132|nr:protein YgfX [Pseudomonas sp. Irchel s3b2]